MKVLITGACGFVGSTLARAWMEAEPGLAVYGLDNLMRHGSEINRIALQKAGVKLFHGDIRLASDFEPLPAVDWVVDAAASPSVLAGVDGRITSRQLTEHNLLGTINILEYCKEHGAGFILLSTSRVYSIAALAATRVEASGGAFRLQTDQSLPPGLSAEGISEQFSTDPPVSLYGGTKLASEALALEYSEAFRFPVWINRCGVLAGAGQFGRADQGIFSFWIHSWRRRSPLTYIGFGGMGYQVRDCLHPRDLVSLLRKQAAAPESAVRRVNIGGGVSHAMSLAQLSDWCAVRFGSHQVESNKQNRMFDVPWVVMNSSLAQATWHWSPETSLHETLEEIAQHAESNPDWLQISGVI